MQDPVIQQVVETLRGATSVMLTVKSSPSVDDLTAAIALTLILNHMDKKATTVFSGHVPSTLEFLQPDMAIEQTTDSLRDFIIALDKEKADKLRYKVEDNVVRIFITPYKTSITEEDLNFSQGDLNVDVVVTLGVLSKDDFDEAVVSHGRILHDATVVSLSHGAAPVEIGTLNWNNPNASGVSEMIAGIAELFGPEVVDNQIATALLTGMVSETDRFKNDKTTPQVLALSSMLMSAGANQQLIAEKMEHLPDASDIQPIMEDIGHDTSGSSSVGASDTSEEIHINEDGMMMPLVQGDEAAQESTPLGERLGGDSNDSSSGGPTDEARMDSSEHALIGAAPPSDSAKKADPSGLFGGSLHDLADVDPRHAEDHASVLEGKVLKRGEQVLSDAPDPSDRTSSESSGPDHLSDVLSSAAATRGLESSDSDGASASSESMDDVQHAKVLPPADTSLESQPEEPQFLVDPIPGMPPADTQQAQTPSSADMPSPSVPDPVEEPQPAPVEDHTTLEDLEHAVHSPPVPDVPNDIVEDVGDFMGSTASATLPVLPALPGEEPSAGSSVGETPAAAPATPAPKYEAPVQLESEQAPVEPSAQAAETKEPEPAAEHVVQMPTADDVSAGSTPSEGGSAPAVPPPLMPNLPQANSKMPVFYEPDGSQSNPFVNP